MKTAQKLYAISRYPAPNGVCPENKDVNQCLNYRGSHDGYMFTLHSPLSSDILKLLNFPWASYGVENVIMWIFKNRLHYKILNPCYILRVYHLHCSGLRSTNRERYNHGGISVVSRPTNDL